MVLTCYPEEMKIQQRKIELYKQEKNYESNDSSNSPLKREETQRMDLD